MAEPNKLLYNDTYLKQIHAEPVKRTQNQERESKQPLLLKEDAEKLQEIAKRFEDKYSPKSGLKKKKKADNEDFSDKSIAHNGNDPFIKTEQCPEPTYKFVLHLGEKEFNEFSYVELVKRAQNRKCESKQPYPEEEDAKKLHKIAKRFEDKYNPISGSKKKKKKVNIPEEFIDKGMGYDETDPFIDNGEAYDELVPSTLATEFGGFYINKGDLEFRNTSDSDFKPKKKQKSIKPGFGKDKKKRHSGLDENQKRQGRRSSNDVSAFKPKKKLQHTVANMLQQHRDNLQRMQTEGQRKVQFEPMNLCKKFSEVCQ